MRETLDFSSLPALDRKPLRPSPRNLAGPIGALVGLALLALAAIVIGRALSSLRLADLLAAMDRTLHQSHGATLVQALLLTCLSYVALIGYDFVAMRQIGARAPFGAVALASFASNAFSFTLGFPLLTGAAVRYWIYGRAALPAARIAQITLVVSLTFWLGMAGVLGLGLVLAAAPLAAIDHLPTAANFCIGAAVLGLLGVYCGWATLERSAPRPWGWVLESAGGRAALPRLMLGVVDIGCAAAALYALLPAESQGLDFTAFAAIYVFAALAGAISHSPGGVGVFEAIMLGAVPAASPEGLLAGLLLFRVVYYLVPFALALAILGARGVGPRWSDLFAFRDAAQRGAAAPWRRATSD